MKKVFYLDGIDCVVCAGKLEEKIKKISGVNEANLNFLLGKLVVEIDENLEKEVENNILKTIKKFDKQISIEY